mmetsp:Transcript_68383/g.154683  ORF Transcript_68383/g.154683 Transcript_68383/m.154683 type:complete len:251 (-) Transcript_68383:369-1121(-)
MAKSIGMRLVLVSLTTSMTMSPVSALSIIAPLVPPSVPLGPITKVAMVKTARASAVIGGGVNLFLYHRNLAVKEEKGIKTWRKTLGDARRAWAQHVFEEKAWLYAIQALRNAITANTCLASLVLSLFTLLVGFVLSNRHYLVEFSPVVFLLLASAYKFSQSARIMNHAGFLFPVGSSEDGALISKGSVETLMMKSEYQQWLGLRYLYTATAFLLWPLVGEWAFLIGTFVFNKFFSVIDRPPGAAPVFEQT